jgi:ceramide glucosyltransferase
MLLRILELIAFLGFAASAAYTAFAIACVVRWSAGVPPAAIGPSAHDPLFRFGNEPPVTIAKPLCGDEPRLYENLRSFCEQDYPEYQVVFGVRDADDPAADVARRLIDERPGRDLQLVVDGRITGTNHKVSNLAAMQPAMKHGIILISDSDMHVGSDYLRAVVTPFADPGVGAVTCLYRGVPARANIASTLGAMAINESFLPSALVARTLQRLSYCFGATIALRRSELDAIGGFAALASQLADDYMVGKLVSDRGSEVVLAPYLVENGVFEPSVRELFLHELRWARTIRSMRPASYIGTVLTMPLAWSVAFAVAARFSTAGLVAIAVAATLRLVLQAAARKSLGSSVPYAPWLVPLRDILTALVFGTAHFGRNVRWKTNNLTVSPGGELSMAAASERIGRNTT